jgi:hypothetical protein
VCAEERKMEEAMKPVGINTSRVKIVMKDLQNICHVVIDPKSMLWRALRQELADYI